MSTKTTADEAGLRQRKPVGKTGAISAEKQLSVSKSSGSLFMLIWCVAGIYASFLSWSFFHERVSVTPYDGEKFKAPLFIQLVQNLFAFAIGLVYLRYKYFASPVVQLESSGNSSIKKPFAAYLWEFFSDSELVKALALVSITQSISTPVGNSSLAHIDFVTYLLAKSCKLIPVLIIHTFLYRRKFPVSKYLIALLITAGVFLFSYKKQKASLSNVKKVSNADSEGNLALGLGYLLASLLLDGLTNSTQDQMFKKFKKLTGIHLMISLNFISFFLVLFYSTVLTNQFSYALQFITRYPQVFYENIMCYAICGAVGQIFIFLTLEHFDSMILITINVTRKMFSMILSLIIFSHPLNPTKVCGIALVFFGIGLESYLKFNQKVKTK